MKAPEFLWDFKLGENDCKKCGKKTPEGAEVCTEARNVYCTSEHVLCCSDCANEDHSSCATVARRRIENELRRIIPLVETILQSYKSKMLELKQSFIAIINDIKKNQEELKGFERKVMGRVESLVREQVDKLDARCASVASDNHGLLAKIEQKIAGFNADSARIAELGAQPGIISLMTNYMELKSIYKSLIASNEIKDYEASCSANQAIKDATVKNYGSLPTLDKLEAVIKDIADASTETTQCQSDSEYLYSFIPLSSHIHVFNIATGVSAIHSLGSEKFRIPYGAASAMCHNRFVLAGGTYDFTNHLSSCYEYSLFLNKLVERKRMNEARSSFAMLEFGGKVYAIGGESSEGYLSSCEAVSLTQASASSNPYVWTGLPSLNERRVNASGCALGGYIFVIGGLTHETFDGQTETRFSPPNNPQPSIAASIERLNMATPRYWKSIGIVDNFALQSFSCLGKEFNTKEEEKAIYVFGGVSAEGKSLAETYVIEIGNIAETKTRELKKLDIKGSYEAKGFESFSPREERATNNIWIMGKSKVHCLNVDDPRNPKWISVSENSKLSI